MMEFFLAATHHVGADFHMAECINWNYGTLKFWHMLGIGASLRKDGRYQTEEWSLDSQGILDAAIVRCADRYRDMRASASLRLEKLEQQVLEPRMPETAPVGQYAVALS